MVYTEFVVLGPPISHQSPGPILQAWRATVAGEAQKNWNVSAATLVGNLKAVVINFHAGDKPSLDVDNMCKPILDVMQKVVYNDDRQIRQAEITHVRIDSPFVFVGAAKILVAAIQAGDEFVFVRIEDPVDPFPLPKVTP